MKGLGFQVKTVNKRRRKRGAPVKEDLVLGKNQKANIFRRLDEVNKKRRSASEKE